MMLQAGDLALVLDTGLNRPGVLQRPEDDGWRDFERDGELVRWPCKVDELPPGRYRVKAPPSSRKSKSRKLTHA